jgi:hypothetical protein
MTTQRPDSGSFSLRNAHYPGESSVKRLSIFLLSLLVLVASAMAADPSERKFIREGMSEGEVLMKIGKPDNESVDTGGGAVITVKRWIYLPTPGDQQTLTTIVLRDGKVIEVSRKVSH